MGLEFAGQFGARNEFESAVGELEAQLGIRLVDDLLDPLGDVWCLYNSPSEGGALLTGLAATVSLGDRRQLERTQEILLGRLESLAGTGETGFLTVRDFEFSGHKVYYLLSKGIPVPVAPAWCFTGSHLHVALYPQMIKSILARDTGAVSLADSPALAGAFSAGEPAIAVGYQDNSSYVPWMWSFVQVMAPMLTATYEREGLPPFDLAAVPSLSAITPHVGPDVSVIRRAPWGIMVEQRQTLPLPGSGLFMLAPLFFGVSLPAAHQAEPIAIPEQVRPPD
jgi:hypothetical protein